MAPDSEFLNNYIIEAFGWTIVHSIWQIALWALVAATVLIVTHNKKASLRYVILVVVMVGICFTSAITFKKHLAKQDITQTTIVTYQMAAENLPDETSNSENEERSNNVFLPERQKILYWFGNYFEAHLPAIVSIWFLGIIFLFLRYLGSFAWLIRLKSTFELASDDFQVKIYKLGRKLYLKRIVFLGTSTRIEVPVTIGHLKPVILFPSRLLTGLSNDQLESILLHELAHIKRNDFLINLLQGFIEIVFFYHPAVWWVSSAIRTEREHACDDLALKGGVKAVTLARTLADLADYITPQPNFSQAFSGKQHKIKNRIHRLILNEKMKTNLSAKVVIAIGLIFSIAAFSFSVQKDDIYRNNERESIAVKQIQSQDVPRQNELGNTDTVKTVTLSTENAEKQDGEKEIEWSDKAYQIDTTSDEEGDAETSELTLKTLMKKGAKEWNRYREKHPGENFDEVLKESNLSGFDLTNFNLSFMNLKEATLINTNFTSANMTGLNIKEANVKGAIFERADLSNSDMKELSMDGNNLRNSILKGANLKEITLINCDLSGADLSGCNLSESTIKNCIFKQAVANNATLFPPGFNWTENGIEIK